jgi:PIN domain nuclease of toxin-antitoxin system
MIEFVLDASAVLADIDGEPGADQVAQATKRSAGIAAANYAEVVSKLVARGMSPEAAAEVAMRIDATVLEADRDRAVAAGALHAGARSAGISLADAFCLALAAELKCPALTSDRDWARLDVGVEVRLIR